MGYLGKYFGCRPDMADRADSWDCHSLDCFEETSERMEGRVALGVDGFE